MIKESFVIEGLAGKKSLKGEIRVGGAKNAALPAMASAFLFKGEIKLENVPDIEDVKRMFELLEELGVLVRKNPKNLSLDAKNAKKTELPKEISKKMRASIILTGPMLARFGQVSFPHPGGCLIGERPIDIFLEGFKKMGATVKETDSIYKVEAKNKKLKAAEIFFKIQSVTATETFLMAALLAEGKTVLRNCALEPEVTSLAEFLVSAGARIDGIGTSTLTIEGGELLNPPHAPYVTIPDRIEAGCFLILGALCASDLEISNCHPKNLLALIEPLKNAGVPLEIKENSILIKNNGKIQNEKFKSFNIKTHEYPGFPTDLQAPAVVFLTQASGESSVFETIFEGRLNYTSDLVKMGADIKIWDAHRGSVKGATLLKGKELEGPDIRAGLAFIIAALAARGRSVISNVYFIDRGYEKIEKRLKAIGAKIKRATIIFP